MVAVRAGKSGHVGVGLYSLSEAARMLHVPTTTLHRWIDPAEGLIARSLDPKEEIITFAELMEAHFVALFRSEGVSPHIIRKAAQKASKKYDCKYPFSFKRFDTDGRNIFATIKNETTGKTDLEDIAKGQIVFEKIMRPFFKKLEYNSMQELQRFWPLHKKGRIVLDPDRKFGKPIDAESGVAYQTILDALNAGQGQSPTEVARWLDIPMAAIIAAKKFEEFLAK
jgi:uncharacterized protein (DUF433 family)